MLLTKDVLHSAISKGREARNATRGVGDAVHCAGCAMRSAIDTSHLPEDALQSAKDTVRRT
jgi:hypothetical protein